MTDDTGEQLLQAILADPASDANRLVYSDWLEETGQHDMAEFIRAQLELAKREAAGEDFASRQRPLWDVVRDLRGQLSWDLPAIAYGLGSWYVTPATSVAPASIRTAYVRRGLIEEVRCPWDDWSRYGDAIRRRHPIRAVELTTWPELRRDDRAGDSYTRFMLQAGARRMLFDVWRDRHFDGGRTDPADDPRVQRDAVHRLLGALWPGVEFRLPPPTVDVLDLADERAEIARRLGMPTRLLRSDEPAAP